MANREECDLETVAINVYLLSGTPVHLDHLAIFWKLLGRVESSHKYRLMKLLDI